jgi:zinc transporter 1/2/3
MFDADACAPTNAADNLGLRVASIFVIGAGGMAGALFPVLARRSRFLRVPTALFKCVLVAPRRGSGEPD